MFEEAFDQKDDMILEELLKFYQKQEGIFCIKELTKNLNGRRENKKFHRTEVVRYLEHQLKTGLLRPVDQKEIKRIIGKKDKRFTYYKIDLDHPFAHWWFDNKRAIAIEVLKKEIGDEAKPIINKLKRKIKTKSILEELKLLQLL